MNTTPANFILESGISLTLLTCIYLIFLRKETYFVLNRIFLLLSVIFSLLLPLFHFTILGSIPSVNLAEVTVTAVSYQNLLHSVTIYGNKLNFEFEQVIESIGIIRYTYLSGVAFFSVLYLVKLIQIVTLIYSNKKEMSHGINLIKLNQDITPFSFFNYVFISRNNTDKSGIKEMITHEMEHVKQLHSLDVVVLELVTILQWFNPIVWMLKRSIRENHEFLADHGVLKPGFSPAAYRLLLLTCSLETQPVIANNFNYSLIKTRIKMMTKMKSSKTASFKLGLGVIATLALLTFFACDNKKPTTKATTPPTEKQATDLPVSSTGEKVYTVVRQMPEFTGGEQALMDYIIKNVTYPEDAKKSGLQGRVLVSFIVNKEGKVIDAKIVQGVDPSLDQEALRVISNMPNWTPGKEKGEMVAVQYTIPVKFALK